MINFFSLKEYKEEDLLRIYETQDLSFIFDLVFFVEESPPGLLLSPDTIINVLKTLPTIFYNPYFCLLLIIMQRPYKFIVLEYLLSSLLSNEFSIEELNLLFRNSLRLFFDKKIYTKISNKALTLDDIIDNYKCSNNFLSLKDSYNMVLLDFIPTNVHIDFLLLSFILINKVSELKNKKECVLNLMKKIFETFENMKNKNSVQEKIIGLLIVLCKERALENISHSIEFLNIILEIWQPYRHRLLSILLERISNQIGYQSRRKTLKKEEERINRICNNKVYLSYSDRFLILQKFSEYLNIPEAMNALRNISPFSTPNIYRKNPQLTLVSDRIFKCFFYVKKRESDEQSFSTNAFTWKPSGKPLISDLRDTIKKLQLQTKQMTSELLKGKAIKTDCILDSSRVPD